MRFDISSLRLRVLLYFGRQPDEELTTQDIEAKFGGNGKVSDRLQADVNRGLLSKRHQAREKYGPVNVYSAGPELLKIINGEQS